MKAEQLVCDLAQSKRLQELGVLQDSIWYYTYYSNSDKYHVNIKKRLIAFIITA